VRVQSTRPLRVAGWQVGQNHEVLARLNGKMRQYRIRVIQGDRVTVGVSPYDLKRGLITYRAK